VKLTFTRLRASGGSGSQLLGARTPATAEEESVEDSVAAFPPEPDGLKSRETKETKDMERARFALHPSPTRNFSQSMGIGGPREEFTLTSETDLYDHGFDSPCMQKLWTCYLRWKRLKEPQRTGWLADLVTSVRFELLTLLMIMINGTLVISETQSRAKIALGDSTGTLSFEPLVSLGWWVDVLFTMFFVVEMMLKLAHHRLYFFVNKDMWWNIFDLVTVISALVDILVKLAQPNEEQMDIGFLRVLRIFRMTRSLRVVRALQIVHSLRQLIDCIMASFAGLFWCIVLLLFITTIFATFLVQCATIYWLEGKHFGPMTDEQEMMHVEFKAAFGSVQAAMLSLFQATSGGADWGAFYFMLKASGFVGPAILVTYIIFFIIAAWNIVTSMFIEKAFALAQPDQEEQMIQRRKKEDAIARSMLRLIAETDTDRSGMISLVEFENWLCNQKVRDFCRMHEIDIRDAELFYRMLRTVSSSEEAADEDEGEVVCELLDVEIKMVVSGLMHMRGQATNLDVKALSFQMLDIARMNEKRHQATSNALRRLNDEVKMLMRRNGISVAEASPASKAAMESVQSDIACFDLQPMTLDVFVKPSRDGEDGCGVAV